MQVLFFMFFITVRKQLTIRAKISHKALTSTETCGEQAPLSNELERGRGCVFTAGARVHPPQKSLQFSTVADHRKESYASTLFHVIYNCTKTAHRPGFP